MFEISAEQWKTTTKCHSIHSLVGKDDAVADVNKLWEIFARMAWRRKIKISDFHAPHKKERVEELICCWLLRFSSRRKILLSIHSFIHSELPLNVRGCYADDDDDDISWNTKFLYSSYAVLTLTDFSLLPSCWLTVEPWQLVVAYPHLLLVLIVRSECWVMGMNGGNKMANERH